MRNRLCMMIALPLCVSLFSSAADQPRPSRPPRAGIWVNAAEIGLIPARGPAWDRLKRVADQPPGVPNISDQTDTSNIRVLAKALVYARTGTESYRAEVIDMCVRAIGSERGGSTLALGRNLAAYVIAADLVGLPFLQEVLFRTWLRRLLEQPLGGRTLRTTHEDRPNNWGTHAGASRAAVAVYLNDSRELGRVAQVFKGWLGDRSAYAGFRYGGSERNLDWQCNPLRPVGINPRGCTRNGHPIGGVLPDDQRRSGRFDWPPPQENYAYEALQGAIVQAHILHRAGYDVFQWEDHALLRAYVWLFDVARFPAAGDDVWQLPLVDYHYGTNFWDGRQRVRNGKNMDFTDWTHGH